jgi:hypothetical protein
MGWPAMRVLNKIVFLNREAEWLKNKDNKVWRA